MPIGEIAGEALGSVLRFLGNIVLEVVLEIVVRGPGYLICRRFKRDINTESGWVVIVGLVFWIAVSVAGYFVYSYFAEALVVDRCLDVGGAYDTLGRRCRLN